MASYVRLTEDEKQYIRDNVNRISTREMAEWIGCTHYAIRYHFRKEGIKPVQFKVWSPEKLRILRALRQDGMAIKDIAKQFNATYEAVHGQIETMKRKGVDVSFNRHVKVKQQR